MSKFDPTKPVRTRDGKPARIICTDAKSSYPIVALVMLTNENKESVCFYKEDGLYNGIKDHEFDLVNIPKKITKEAYVIMQKIFGDKWNTHSIQDNEAYANDVAKRLTAPSKVVPVTLEFEE